jgi:predicted Zn-dependent protease
MTGTNRPGPRKRSVLSIALLLLAGCNFASDEGAGGERGEGPGGREQPLALDPRQELQAGREAYQEVLQEYRGRILPASNPDVVRCKRIVDRLARAVEIEPLQREIHLRIRGYVFEWEVSVVSERQANAFCLPAGKMVVFTGIIPVAGTDGQLAAVLSHEMAHALAHHASERVARERGGGSALRRLSYDRYQESEADHIGVFLMAFADYDPNEAVEFWLRMQQATGDSGVPELLSDHPTNRRRIEQLRKWAPQAKEAKRAFDEGRIAPAGR